MYYYCDVIACLIQGCRIIHTVTWLFLGYGFLFQMNVKNFEKQIGQAERRTHNLLHCSQMSYPLRYRGTCCSVLKMTQHATTLTILAEPCQLYSLITI